MPTIAPWLNVKPSDFLTAAESGAKLGEQIAARKREQDIEIGRIGAQSQEAGARLAMAQREHDDALKQQEMNRRLREFEGTQRLKIAQDELDRQELEGQQRYLLGLSRLDQMQSKADRDEEHNRLLEGYRGNMLDVARRRLALEEQGKTSQERAKRVGRVMVPLTQPGSYEMNPPKIELPADDPRVQMYLNQSTNVPSAFQTGAVLPPPGGRMSGIPPVGTAPSTNRIFNYDPESGELNPMEDETE